MKYEPYVLFGILVSFCFADFSAYGNEFYKDGENSRISAMGGVSDLYISLTDCIFNNDVHSSFNFSYKNKFSNLAKVSSFSILFPDKKKPIFLKLINRSIDEIYDTNSAWIDDGDFVPEAGEIDYFKIKEIKQQEIGISLTTVRSFKSYLIGFSFKPSFINLAEFSGYGFSFDIITLKQLSRKLNFIMEVNDLFAFKYWNTESFEEFSPMIRSGVFYGNSFFNGGFYFGGNINDDTPYKYNVGIEFIKDEYMFFRAGTSYENLFSIGFGIKTSILNIDYGYLHSMEKNFSNATQIISLKISLDDLVLLRGKIKP